MNTPFSGCLADLAREDNERNERNSAMYLAA